MTKDELFIKQKDSLHQVTALILDSNIYDKKELSMLLNAGISTIEHWANRGRALNEPILKGVKRVG